MYHNHFSPPPELPEEEYSDLEISIGLELSTIEFGPETETVDEMMPEHYIFQDDYLGKELERQQEKELEDLAKMLQPRIP